MAILTALAFYVCGIVTLVSPCLYTRDWREYNNIMWGLSGADVDSYLGSAGAGLGAW